MSDWVIVIFALCGIVAWAYALVIYRQALDTLADIAQTRAGIEEVHQRLDAKLRAIRQAEAASTPARGYLEGPLRDFDARREHPPYRWELPPVPPLPPYEQGGGQ